MASFFGKVPEDPLMGVVDGWDEKAIYQMVPEGGSRRGIKVTAQNEEVEVRFEPFGVVKIAPESLTAGNPYTMRLAPRASATIQLVAEKVGHAELTVRARDGTALETLMVSVKSPLRKTYALNVVSDMVQGSPWVIAPPPDGTPADPSAAKEPRTNLRPMMEKVKKCFLHQANVIIEEQFPKVFEVKVPDRNLGNPIFLDRPMKPDGKTPMSLVIGNMPLDAVKADFWIYYTWDIRENNSTDDIVGIHFLGTKVIFVEFDSKDEGNNALTTAHEICHALGVRYHNGGRLLMHALAGMRSSQLQQHEIDQINPSGLDTRWLDPSKKGR